MSLVYTGLPAPRLPSRPRCALCWTETFKKCSECGDPTCFECLSDRGMEVCMSCDLHSTLKVVEEKRRRGDFR